MTPGNYLDFGNPDTEDHPPVSVDRCPDCGTELYSTGVCPTCPPEDERAIMEEEKTNE